LGCNKENASLGTKVCTSKVWNSGGMITGRGKAKTRRKTIPTATLSSINPTRTALKLDPGMRCEKPANKRPSNDMAIFDSYTAGQETRRVIRSMKIFSHCSLSWGSWI